MLRFAAWSSGLLGLVVFAAFVLISRQIGLAVRQTEQVAVKAHPGEGIAALMAYVEDSRHGFQQRNRAVWALGQLGDRRALPLLRKHFTGGPCNHANALCQRELDKAIKLLEGDRNATAIVWRRQK